MAQTTLQGLQPQIDAANERIDRAVREFMWGIGEGYRPYTEGTRHIRIYPNAAGKKMMNDALMEEIGKYLREEAPSPDPKSMYTIF